MELPEGTIRRIMNKECNKNIRKNAVIKLIHVLEDDAKVVVEKAVENAENDGRVTVRQKDMRRALKDCDVL